MDEQKEQQCQAHWVRGVTGEALLTKEKQRIMSTKEEQGAQVLAKDY